MRIKDRIVCGKRLGDLIEQPVPELAEASKQVGAEGAVLLKSNGMLPLKKGDKVAFFGRMQKHYYKSGTGSGGLVNTEYVTNIFDELDKLGLVELNRNLEKIYTDWETENPYDNGESFWNPPWYQKEMVVSEELAKNMREESDKALIVIGRTAGESRDHDTANYTLTEEEYETIKNISSAFEDTCVILNVGNIIDMKWADELNVSNVMYVWQSGQDGGTSAAEVLCGLRYPSGKLADTIAYNITDYPAYETFFEFDKLFYTDDIFVGYRYFETFAKDKVLYPFGFGLSYTSFDVKTEKVSSDCEKITAVVNVKNTGDYKGKEVVQIYFESPSGKLSKPARELIAFKKTKELAPNEEDKLEISFDIADMASYDENGVTGHESCYVLESGDYKIYIGTDVRTAEEKFVYTLDSLHMTKQCARALAASDGFEKMINNGGTVAYEKVEARQQAEIPTPKEIVYTGDKGIKLADVYNKNATMTDFVAQLSDFELACLSQGEGMNSPKVRPGCGGAFGGVTEELRRYGMPVICVTDGPSGIRLENGDTATNIPCGATFAASWNEELAEELYTYEGMELYAYGVDALLGPGINIHRFPLCGRNFEYFSEDPYLAGCIGRGMCAGLHNAGVTATIKHFAANNKEENRNYVDTVVSETAMRQIYLKPFEIVVKNGKTKMLMTAYNQVNGAHCAGNYDLATRILRDEWKYDGIVMTDWWAATKSSENEDERFERCHQIKSQNDVYMVNNDSETTAKKIMEQLEEGRITRGELQRNAINLCSVIIQMPTFEKYIDGELDLYKEIDLSSLSEFFMAENPEPEKDYITEFESAGDCGVKIKYTSTSSELEQITVKLHVNDKSAGIFIIRGTSGKEKEATLAFTVMQGENKFQLSYSDNVTIKEMKIFK